MKITDIVSEEYVEFSPDAPVSKLVGAFEDPALKAVVVRGDEYEGVVTRRQLADSRHPPDQRIGSLVWPVARVAPTEDVRTVARLMIEGGTHLLPVFEGEQLAGVVTADAILGAVGPFLDAATVAEASTDELVTVAASATVAEAVAASREHRITHLPVLEDDAVVGILSLHDVVEFTVRPETRAQGGDSDGSGRTRRGGFGAREGDSVGALDAPVRDVMVTPVRTIAGTETLETAVDEMFEAGVSSLVVEDEGRPVGIVTKTDVLDALTWEARGNRAVQIYGTDLLDDVSYDDVVAMVDSFDDRDHGSNVLDARIHLHEHDETRRGTNLVLARVRLSTDHGMVVASGEGYGAKQALSEARDAIERQIRDRKTKGRSKKHPDEAHWERRFGWMLEATP